MVFPKRSSLVSRLWTLGKKVTMSKGNMSGITNKMFILKPAVLDNLLTSMKIVLRGMGKLRINLANQKNKVRTKKTKKLVLSLVHLCWSFIL